MLRAPKPSNARSKRALDARAPKEIEDARTCIFVRGTRCSQTLQRVMGDLMALKRPDAISFSKKNSVHPFDEGGTASFEFWSGMNDAGFFVFGHSTKKRPDGLTFVRIFDGRVLDMLEVGVKNYVGISDIKGVKSTPGHKPLLHFASSAFDTNPRLAQLKSMLMALFNGEEVGEIHLKGLEHVISVSCSTSEDTIHLRTYTTSLHNSSTRVPRIQLHPMGPSLDLTLYRHADPDPELLKASLRRPKLKKTDVEKGLGKKRKNLEVDDMGDLRGRIHVGKQDLEGLKGKRMKGLRGEAVTGQMEED